MAADAFSVTADPHPHSEFAALSEHEFPTAILTDPAVRRALDSEYSRGYREGFTKGALFVKAECSTDHADLLTQLDTARRFAELGGRPGLAGVDG
ncbi:hypothetical protein [Sinomonas albida]|uniref:hypothetical protein n=1 Tax=Sinomonas albida TaxID=369942 RepID=UPI003018BE23